jgi:guanylate kinase
MSSEMRRGVCLVLSAPSGAGKSTIAKALRAREPGLVNSVSVTTRAPRPGEQEGVDYFFRTQAQFDQMVAEGGFAEWASVFGRSYGTPKALVEQALASGRDMIFDIDWQGYQQLKAAMPGDVVGLFVLPPSLEELRNRLEGRGTDSGEVIEARMGKAMAEISHWGEFDHVLVNDDLLVAIEQAHAVLLAARTAVSRQKGFAALGF